MPRNAFYDSAAWKRARNAFMVKHPICSTPGCGRPTKTVDHKKAIAAGGAPLDEGNFDNKCWSCHSRKTAALDRPSMAPGKKGLGAKGCDASGRPFDPHHHWNVKPDAEG